MAETSVGVATAFYAALVAKDADAIGALVDRWFADDAVLVLPPSLPYGGRIETARRLRRMFTALAQGDAAAGPTGMTIAAVAGGEEHVAVQLEFGWRAPGTDEQVPSGALELWSFADGKVREIRAYYWDTAAIVSAG